MVWGYGRNGYGAYRTANILAVNAHAGERLLAALRKTRARGGPAGLAYLAENRLKGLGVAFATKYLYFCGAGYDVPAALILDRIVSGWLASHTGWRPRLDWRIDDYTRYCELVDTWAQQLGTAPDTVEYLMFADGTPSRSQWATPDLVRTRPTEELDPADAVLDALSEAADAFEALPGGITPEDAEDFERGIRQLRRIVLTRTPQD